MAAISTALVAVAAAGAAYQGVEAHKARKDAKAEMGRQNAEQKKLESEAAAKKKQDEAVARERAKQAALRGNQAATAGIGRSDTILTSPLGTVGSGGAPGMGSGAKKTLLGA
jgi:hypothetical protein